MQRTVRSLLGNVVTSQPCETCQGYGTTIPYPCATCQGQGRVRSRRTVSLDIPAGVETGLRLQLPGSGEVGPAGGPNGDLYIEVTVAPHEVFSRDGDDLLATLEVSMPDAMLGTTTTIEAPRRRRRPRDPRRRAGRRRPDDQGPRHHRRFADRSAETSASACRWSPRRAWTRKERALIEDFAKRTKAPAPKLAQFQQGMFSKLRDRFRNALMALHFLADDADGCCGRRSRWC